MAGMLLYDGECRFCTTSALWLQRHATSDAEVRAWQQADLVGLGVSAQQCAEAVQWVGNGHRSEGPEALAAYLETSTGAWRATGRLLSVPVSQAVARPLYRWLAPHRSRWAGAGSAASAGPPEPPPPRKHIRRRRDRDLAACARLLRVVSADGQYPVYWPEAPRSWLADEEVIDAWIAEHRGQLVGHVAISAVDRDPATALRWREMTGRAPSELAGVSRLYVRPGMTGQGIGSTLLDVAVREIRARGLSPVLDVVSASRDAIRLYEDRGWRLVGMYDWGRPSDKLRILYYAAPPLLGAGT